MEFTIDGLAERRLEDFMASIGDVLGNQQRRASFATYAMGLWGDGERKSMEPIAARACADPKLIDAEHQRLHHFITCANWDDRGVRQLSAHYAIDAMSEHGPIEAWIIDDTGMRKLEQALGRRAAPIHRFGRQDGQLPVDHEPECGDGD